MVKEAFALDVLEAAYNLELDERGALLAIAQAAASATSTGPIGVCSYRRSDGLPDLAVSHFARADERYILTFDEGARALPIGMRRSLLSLAPTVISAQSEHVDRFPSDLRSSVREMILLTIMGNTGDGGSLSVAFGDPKARKWVPAQLHQAGVIAQHLAASWRLRAVLSSCNAPPTVAAELRTDGTVMELGRETNSPSAREWLRHAVIQRERARTKRRSRNELELWPALIAGRWSLVDAFTASGSRYIVAYENPPQTESLRALTERERIVLEYALVGRPGKWIALELGVSEPTVARTLRSALRRIGVTNTAVLAGVREDLFELFMDVGSGIRLVMARLPCRMRLPAHLSSAERAIAAKLMLGRSIAEVARSRGTSPRTVSHQITSLYTKLGVSSLRELIALLA